mmetsp:Transcript_33197/g.75146  ORF Transcript_33197/g.75146 Transcript_33197/m.75146 type:complete len:227 (-) Transcript_33197:136-816(-)
MIAIITSVCFGKLGGENTGAVVHHARTRVRAVGRQGHGHGWPSPGCHGHGWPSHGDRIVWAVGLAGDVGVRAAGVGLPGGQDGRGGDRGDARAHCRFLRPSLARVLPRRLEAGHAAERAVRAFHARVVVLLGRRGGYLAAGRLAVGVGTRRVRAHARGRRLDGRGGRDGVAGFVGRAAVEGGVAPRRVGGVAVDGGREGDRGYSDHPSLLCCVPFGLIELGCAALL